MNGVVYFTVGTSHLERLFVSLSSLRQHNPCLPVTVIAEQSSPLWLEAEAARFDTRILRFPKEEGDSALTTKIHSLSLAPYDINFFLDADTIVVQPIDSAFIELGKYDFGFVHFAGWRSDGNILKKRIQSWTRAGATEVEIQKATCYGKAINVGTFLFRRGHPFLKEWHLATRRGTQAKIFIPDEVYAQISLPKLNAVILGPEWGVSVKHGVEFEAKIIHYHGDKHQGDYPMCRFWRKEAERVTVPPEEPCMTVVVAVDDGYWKRFAKSYATWESAGLFCLDKHKLHVVTDGSISASRLQGLVKYPHTHSVYHGTPEMTQRERMITSFVLHIPPIITTEFLVKLDADCSVKPGTKLFHSPSHFNYDIISHRWGYTKPAKWLIELERWRKEKGVGQQVIDTTSINADAPRHRHPRFQSFVCLQRTSSSRTIANLFDKRLPVPSHDTCTWFVATALGMKVCTHDLKRWGYCH